MSFCSKFLSLLLALSVLAQKASGIPATSDMASLEIQVYTSEESSLENVENQIVKVIQRDPTHVRAHYLMSMLLIRKFSREPSELSILKQASELAQQAIDLQPRSPFGYVAMASILDVMSSQDRAMRLLEEAEARGVKQNWRFDFLRARLVSANAGSKRVLELLDRSLSFPDVLLQIVVPHVIAILQSEHSGHKLISQLQKWNEKYPSTAFQLTEATSLSEMNDHKGALKKYSEILTNEPLSREALISSAVVFYQHGGESKKALANLELALQHYKASMPSGVLGMVYAHRGAAFLKIKKYKEAKEEFLSAAALDPENMGILDFITRIYKEEKAYSELAQYLKEINLKLVGRGVYHALLGETLSEHLQNHEEAIRAFTNALVLEPERGDYYHAIGLAFYRKKEFSNALKYFNIATDLDPQDATARYNEACALALLGRGEEALSTLAQAFSIDSRLIFAARTDQDLASLKGLPKFWDLVKEPASHAASKISH